MSATHIPDIGDRTTSRLRQRYLFGPTIDLLLLGGGSLIALLLLRLFLGGDESAQTLSLGATLALANLINHPHFAHSYQIFYSGIRTKLRSDQYPSDLRRQYLFVGFVAPMVIGGYLAWTVIFAAPRMLGLAANAMFFLVGWHYVKQGYGMAMVDAVLKRAFYTEHEKRWLLANAYATWILSWLLINYLIGKSTKAYFGIEYFAIPVPIEVVIAAGAAAGFTAITIGQLLLRSKHPIAWNGLIAYFTTIYAWLLIRDPIVILWVPLFHSLQYLAVVWRFQWNKSRASRVTVLGSDLGYGVRMFGFIVGGSILGYAGFWVLPSWLNAVVPYNRDLFGPSLFFFLVWVFINIHHYLLDTVMWRKGNPDVAKHLFS
ncbi:hypothetical protein E5843_12445 [Luteimonas yindakuii]|uniref:hypothetical protein n=1 Tax=Luteimonas yindakuii TaxID=2565782 RepID=UPI001107A425|nr:hypothetical protein [Luteimonas yindakuii]QCO68375.2 hypothetical protein E5843_12445 [Luteimonas yindakuii]